MDLVCRPMKIADLSDRLVVDSIFKDHLYTIISIQLKVINLPASGKIDPIKNPNL